ncbi:hypothetical protein [Pseudoduganella aquatica]|uniref:Twin-arginine translocation pathway signal protein n=1 Tax=Pseudoduganella aquatica TaxID=2660641 RepID=A0A7X4HHV9_9BURK|nr:hypothetical protein [Pseudoduganella aquatica]MYN10822.1 hypothetical protein [Pseudoduganella aquatica]
MLKRRTFLKTGVLGALALAAGGALYRSVQGAAPLQRYVLDGEARAVLVAIIPAIVGPMLPPAGAARDAAVSRTTDGIQQAVASLPLSTQKEVQDLFGLLALAPARRLLAGVPAWRDTTPEQAAAFLQDWRLHRLEMLQTAYHALHDLVLGAWYADPASWAGAGYPGPIKELS